MSFITGLTRMWLTRTAKPFTFKNGYDQILPGPVKIYAQIYLQAPAE